MAPYVDILKFYKKNRAFLKLVFFWEVKLMFYVVNVGKYEVPILCRSKITTFFHTSFNMSLNFISFS